MATITKWSGISAAMQSAIAATKTISAITKAAPGVVSSTAHGYSNGDFVFLQVSGMRQLHDRVFRVCNVATDTFQIEDVSGGTGIDTSAYDTFVSGTAQKLTFGTSITSITSISIPNATFETLDATTVHDTQRVVVPGLMGETKADLELIWDPTDAACIALKAASDAQSKRAFKITFGTGGRIMVFAGYVGFNGAPAGAAQEIVKTSGVITSQGSPTYYSA